MNKKRIAVFASGNGTNAEKIFENFKNHDQVEVVLLLSNKKDAGVLDRAKKEPANKVLRAIEEYI